MATQEINNQKGTRILIGVPPRTMTLGDLLPDKAIVQSAIITIDCRDAVRVSCNYVVKEKEKDQ